MINIRKSQERGHFDRGWIDSYHTFSFGSYQDPEHMGFRALRVLNEDRIAPGKGFGPHAHRDMEIITYVLQGSLAHRDSMGERHVLGPNEIQVMSAGNGVVHSEFNGSDTEPVHLLQIWIDPKAEDLTPSYQQIAFAPDDKCGRVRPLAAPAPGNGGTIATINQDARLHVSALGCDERVTHTLAPGRHAWVQVVRGVVSLNGRALVGGDGAALSNEPELAVAGHGPDGGEILLFDLA